MDEPVADIGCRRTGREAEDGDAEDQTGGDGDALADVSGSRGPEDRAGGEEDDNITTLSWIQAVIRTCRNRRAAAGRSSGRGSSCCCSPVGVDQDGDPLVAADTAGTGIRPKLRGLGDVTGRRACTWNEPSR